MLRVLFFAQMRNRTGAAERTLPAAPGLTGDTLWADLAAEFPAIAELRPSVRLAVNGAFASFATPLRSGDEVVFITPVSGG